VDAGIVSFGRLSFRIGGYSDNERRSSGVCPSPPPPVRMETPARTALLKGDASTLKLASLRFEV
jgi:hypothetical protein